MIARVPPSPHLHAQLAGGGERERHRFRCLISWAMDLDAPLPPEAILKALTGHPTFVSCLTCTRQADGAWSLRAVRKGRILEASAPTWQETLKQLAERLLASTYESTEEDSEEEPLLLAAAHAE